MRTQHASKGIIAISSILLIVILTSFIRPITIPLGENIADDDPHVVDSITGIEIAAYWIGSDHTLEYQGRDYQYQTEVIVEQVLENDSHHDYYFIWYRLWAENDATYNLPHELRVQAWISAWSTTQSLQIVNFTPTTGLYLDTNYHLAVTAPNYSRVITAYLHQRIITTEHQQNGNRHTVHWDLSVTMEKRLYNREFTNSELECLCALIVNDDNGNASNGLTQIQWEISFPPQHLHGAPPNLQTLTETSPEITLTDYS
jgi:hypothetical protein